MKLTLFPFQNEAKRNLLKKISIAQQACLTGDSQVIVFSAPTASGKTTIMTSLIEDIFYGSDESVADDQAVILWMSDMPDLNEQSKKKMEVQSDKIRLNQLITLDASFDKEELDPGNIYFLNTQKIANDRLLTTKTDKRAYSIWETLNNTAADLKGHFIVVVDEAHKGMMSTSEANTAQSIIQKLFVGSPEDGLSSLPLIIGLSATPQRFNKFLEHCASTVYKVPVKPSDVVGSGLIKDEIIVYYPDLTFGADQTMLKAALGRWKEMSEQWISYCSEESKKKSSSNSHANPVKPILLIQVEDGKGSIISQTDIGECLNAIVNFLGRPLKDGEAIQTFMAHSDVTIGDYLIRYVDPSSIQDDQDISFVFFKMNLSTGWDCPRAEVMASFRTAKDYTYIAQVMGRLERTPLAHRVESNQLLNSVSLYLPFFDQKTAESVINSLKNDEDIASPSKIVSGNEILLTVRNKEFLDAFDHMDEMVTYRIEKSHPDTNTHRLLALARALVQDGIDTDVSKIVVKDILAIITKRLDESKKSKTNYENEISKITGVKTDALSFLLGSQSISVGSDSKTVDIAPSDIDSIFHNAGKRVGDGLEMEYWMKNKSRNSTLVKAEFILASKDPAALKDIDDYSTSSFNILLVRHRKKINELSEERKQFYDRIILSSATPSPIDWVLPKNIDYPVASDSKAFLKHMFVGIDGSFRTTLDSWEEDVIKEEMGRPDFRCWLRNLDRKDWAIEIPYFFNKQYSPLYPDMMIVRRVGDKYFYDILEPHNQSLADNVAKAKGLAEFAEKHGDKFSRIQLIRKYAKETTEQFYYRLDFSNKAVRDATKSITTDDELNAKTPLNEE
jgi:type III restriction enzyme